MPKRVAAYTLVSLCAALCQAAAQAPDIVTLEIEWENGVNYFGDNSDLTKLATSPVTVNANTRNFMEGTAIADIVSVNGKPAKSLVEQKWLEETFIPVVQQRGAAIIKARGASSAASAASAAVSSLRCMPRSVLSPSFDLHGIGATAPITIRASRTMPFSVAITAAKRNQLLRAGSRAEGPARARRKK